MTAPVTEPTAGPTTDPAQPAAAAPPTAADPASPTDAAASAPAAPSAPPEPAGLPDDPEALKAEIAKLRRENASDRTNAKTKAADDARKELAQTIGKALGLVEDETDPVKLAEQVAASTAEAKQARLELAVYQAAVASNVDATALLDSRTFLAKVADIDPSNTTEIAAVIGEMALANPALAARTTTLPAPNPAQGSSGNGTPNGQLTREALAAMSPEQIDKARREGRLNALLGIKT